MLLFCEVLDDAGQSSLHTAILQFNVMFERLEVRLDAPIKLLVEVTFFKIRLFPTGQNLIIELSREHVGSGAFYGTQVNVWIVVSVG